MQEVKEICDRMLAEPGPPMTSPEELLSFARRARARQHARLGIGFAATTTLFVTAALPLLASPSRAPSPAIVVEPSPSPPPFVKDLVPGLPADQTVLVRDTFPDGRAYWMKVLRTPATAPPPTADLCQVELPKEFTIRGELGPCEVFVINGSKIRAGSYRVTETNGVSYEIQYAVRYVNDKALMALHASDRNWVATPPATAEPQPTPRQIAEQLASVNFS